VPVARISPLAYPLMQMSRRGSFPHGQVESTHGKKREKHTSSPQPHRKGTKPPSILAAIILESTRSTYQSSLYSEILAI